jgi:very-short-patch-repair endonuclease
LDGDSHSERTAHDETRTKFFEVNGYRVIRFENPDVFDHTDAVLEKILQTCERLSPPPAGEG